jgi:hypothetical protein
MRAGVIAGLFVAGLCWFASAALAQDEKQPGAKAPKKGDTITVKGCLDGGVLVATESDALEATGLLATGITFRLTGDKRLLKELRDEHDHRVMSVRGVLKSDLPRLEGQSRNLGRMRITIGGANPNPNSPQAMESRRSLPVLEARTFERVADITCGR